MSSCSRAALGMLAFLTASVVAAAERTITTGDGLEIGIDDATGELTGLRIDGLSVRDFDVEGGLFVRDRARLLEPSPSLANFAPNASLEIDSQPDGLPDGWIFSDGWGRGATLTMVADAFDGAVAAQIDDFAGGTLYVRDVVVQPDTRYVFQAMTKGTAASYILVVWKTADGTFLFYEAGRSAQPATDWNPVHIIATAPPNASFADIYLYSISDGDALFDLIQFNQAPPWAYSTITGSVTGSGSTLTQIASLAEVQLDVEATYTAYPDHIEIDVLLSDTSGADRALEAGFVAPVLPVRWFDNLRESRQVTQELYSQHFSWTGYGGIYDDGHWGRSRSVYPFGAVGVGANLGLALGIDLRDGPSDHFVFHSTHVNEAFTALIRLGIAPEPTLLPGQARYRLLLYRIEGDHGFRSALEGYYRILDPVFENRMPRAGGWSAWRSASSIPTPDEFGVAVHTWPDDPAGDEAAAVLTTAYVDSFDYWLPLGDYSVEPTHQEALDRLDFNANDPAADPADIAGAQMTMVSGMHDPSGVTDLAVVQVGWMPGSGWAAVCGLNADPEVSDRSGNGWSSRSDEDQARVDAAFAAAQAAGAALDGVFFDWFRANRWQAYDHRRQHFETTDSSLTFDPTTLSPAIRQPQGQWEAVLGFADDMHARGLFTMARDIERPDYWATSVIDAMGDELNWTSTETSDQVFGYYRAVAGRKPYMLMLDADYAAGHDVAHALRRALLYGLALTPNWDTSTNQYYWDDLTLVDRDRPLFRHFSRLHRLQSSAGWEPMTRASSSVPSFVVERFGDGVGEPLLFAGFHADAAPATVTVTFDLQALGLVAASVRRVVDLVERRTVAFGVNGSSLEIVETIDADAARLYWIHHGAVPGGVVLHAVRVGDDVRLTWSDGGRTLYEVLAADAPDL